MAVENVVLVAGFNYEDPADLSFMQNCDNRIARLLAKSSSKDDMVFTVFDVGGGRVRRSKVDPKTKKRAWTDVKTFTPVTSANYSSFTKGQQNHFDTNPAGVMSITDVYDAVQAIGAGAEKGTLSELSFFSHGWIGGPILVNSFDPHSNDATLPRDPDDKDARVFKDFTSPTMDNVAQGHFADAFSSSGIVWTWGCSFARPVHIVFGQLFKTSKYRSTPPGKIKDTDTFTLDFSVSKPTPTVDDIDAINNILLPGGKRSGNNYTVKASLLDIKNMVDSQIATTYAIGIAATSAATVFAALPGTYADEEKNVRQPLMVVPRRKPPYDDDLSATLKFYTTYMGTTLDPENRGYGKFS